MVYIRWDMVLRCRNWFVIYFLVEVGFKYMIYLFYYLIVGIIGIFCYYILFEKMIKIKFNFFTYNKLYFLFCFKGIKLW